MLESILSWCKREENVRLLALTGSRREEKAVHELSDYDVVLFVKDPEKYLKDSSWISSFGRPWVIVREKIKVFKKTVHTRLVIFEKGLKVDWTIVPLDMLKIWMQNIPSFILLDKDQLLSQETVIPQKKSLKPSKKVFQNVIEEFWFEVYHVAVALKRQDFWSAHYRFGLIRDHFLRRMIEWHTMAQKDWKTTPPHNGKNMASWVSEKTWNEVKAIFPHCTQKECFDALMKCMNLFRTLGLKTAICLGFSYPTQIDETSPVF